MSIDVERLKHYRTIERNVVTTYVDSIGILTNNKEVFQHRECIVVSDANAISIYEKLDHDSNIYNGYTVYFKSQITKISIVGMNNKKIKVNTDEMGRMVEVEENDGTHTETDK